MASAAALAGIGAAGVSSLGSIGGSFLSSAFQAKAARQSYKYTRDIARNQASWAVTGLKRAGINPILAAGGGVFGGGARPVSAPSFPGAPDIGASLSRGVSSAIAMKKFNKEMELLRATIHREKAATGALTQQGGRDAATALRTVTEDKLLKTDLPRARADEALYKTPPGKSLRTIERIKNAISPWHGTSARGASRRW